MKRKGMRNSRDPCGSTRTSAKSGRINRHGEPLALHKTSETVPVALRLRPLWSYFQRTGSFACSRFLANHPLVDLTNVLKAQRVSGPMLGS